MSFNETQKKQADHQKEKGNEYFKAGNYDEAIRCYTEAIQLFASNAVLYGNRSIAYYKKGLLLEAENDCTKAISIDNKYIKGYYRRGLARKQLHRYQSALNDFMTVLQLDPNNKDAHNEINCITKIINSKDKIELKPIVKDPQFQSKQPLVNVPINEMGVLSIIEPRELPLHVPKTYYQFECDWRQFTGTDKIYLRLQYLQMIGAEKLLHLFSSSTLEPNTLSEIIIALSFCDDLVFVFQTLSHLTRAQRFNTLVMFLSDDDNTTLKKMFERLLKCNELQHENVLKIASVYSLSL